MKKSKGNVDSDHVRSQLETIIESPEFTGSQRHRKFLAYITNETLAGRADRIKAYAIATEVFGRGDDFDPQIDPIVRIEAHRLRRALDHYYLTAGKNDPIRITIPKGGYGAVFERVTPSSIKVSTSAQQLDSLSDASQHSGKPTIAVLPFDNISGDPDQEYFADGITEDVITELSRFREFSVIAKNSTFVFKGVPVDIRTVSQALGAQYVVEGGIQRSESRVRITVQLVDSQSGTHLWAERFDRDLVDVFAVQDEVVSLIISAIAPRSIEAELRRGKTLTDTAVTSWDLVLQARFLIGQHERNKANRAQGLLLEAIRLDPGIAQAHSWLAYTKLIGTLYGWEQAIDALRKDARELAHEAISFDPDDALGHAIAGFVYLYADGAVDRGIAAGIEALNLNPNLAFAHGLLCGAMSMQGELDAANENLEAVLRLSPRDPNNAMWIATYNIGAFAAGQYEDVVKRATKAIEINPGFLGPHRQRAASLAMLGQCSEAQKDVARILKMAPGHTIEKVREQVSSFLPELELYLRALHEAGLPE